MRIVKLTAENVKRLKAVEITPTGDIVQVTGRNRQGKTSVLDAIWWALGGTKNVQARPIHKGKSQASVELDLGKYLVTRRWTKSGSYLHVAKRSTESTGTVDKPQQILDGLLSKVAFDPLSFIRMKAPQQAELLRGVVGLDTSKIDAKKADLTLQRRDLGREIPTILPVCGPDPGPEISINDAMRKLAAARDEEKKHEAAQRNNLQAADTLVGFDLKVKRLADDLQKAKDALKDAKEVRDEAHSAAESAKRIAEATPTPTDIAELSEDVTKAADHNQLVQAHQRQQAIVADDRKKRTDRETLTRRIEHCSEQRAAMIHDIAMPLEGLSFDDFGEITFDGYPLDQASSAEQLRISIEIAMASQPELRIIRITDGSLLDSESLEAIRKTAAAGDYQVWIESVSESGKVGVVIEDGEVVADNQEATA